MLTHLSLFSGIGGIDLAAEWAGFETVGQCEWADYPTKVLEKHWPNVERWKDVKDFTAESFYKRTGRKTVDLISGGFPCQPHSVAGKRQASDDERDMWPEYRRIIGEIRPKWIVAENVRGLISSEHGEFFRGILRDLSDMGFDVGWCSYPASWVGAVHRRERIFTIAHDSGERVERIEQKEILGQQELQGGENVRGPENLLRGLPVHEPKLCRTFNGISHQVDRLKCLGNAVVPQQVYPILKAIAEMEQP